MAPEAVVHRLAGRRDLDTEKIRGVFDDMIRDRREARGAIKLSGGGDPMEVGWLRFRDVVSEAPVEGSIGDGESSE